MTGADKPRHARLYQAPTLAEIRRALDAVDSRTKYDHGVVVKDGFVDLSSGPGWVYFMVAGDDRSIKIGWSRNPHGRVSTLQTGQPEALRFLGIIPGTRREEATLHRFFRQHRLAGEWFEYQPIEGQIKKLIKSRGYAVEGGFDKDPRTIPELGESTRNKPTKKRQ